MRRIVSWIRKHPFYTVVLALALLTGLAVVGRLMWPDQARPAAIQTAGPTAIPTDLPSPMDVHGLPATGPSRAGHCGRPALSKASGAWVVPWEEDASQIQGGAETDLVPAQARRLGLLDFFWLSLGPSPSSLQEQSARTHLTAARPLDDVLTAAAEAKPCGLRLVTLVDSYNASDDPDGLAHKQLMAQILLNPAARAQNVRAIAQEMAAHPLADGLTLDYEFSLPETSGEVGLFAKAAGLPEDATPQIMDRLSKAYTQFVADLAAAMHHQHRLLRVAVPVRTDNGLNSEYPKPYAFDYSRLGWLADQIIIMAYDFHYSTGDPGPIAPLASIDATVNFARAQSRMPAGRIAVAVPAYSYDWTVSAAGKNLDPNGTRDYTPTELGTHHWQVMDRQDGETEYTYRVGPHQHVVWDAASGVGVKVQHIRGTWGYPVMAWKVGNEDPRGSQIVLDAMGS
jgi:hypothetical protein